MRATCPAHLIMNFHIMQFSQISCRRSSFGIVTGYGLDDRDSGVQILARAGNFSLLHHIQTGSGAHPASYPMVTGGFLPLVERPVREADHLPPSSAKVQDVWRYTSAPHDMVLS
jgi:hypothetical protein